MKGLYFLAAQMVVMLTLIAVDAVMFWWLVNSLIDQELSPTIAALLGTLIGAITTGIGLGAKDFFDARDMEGN